MDKQLFVLILTLTFCVYGVMSDSLDVEDELQLPTVFVPLFVRNKAHAMPAFFGCLERINYPKQRMFLWIRTDHNVDNSTAMLQEWVAQARKYYHTINFEYKTYPQRYVGESGPMDWPEARFKHLIMLRQQALEYARNQWADYMFTVDVDNFLEEPDVLLDLISTEKIIIAPVLDSSSMYSNFWDGMNENGYYKRTERYPEIIARNITGLFEVPVVHSTVLINLKLSASKSISYTPPRGYSGDIDDMLIFASSARTAGVPMYVTNAKVYGQLLVPTQSHGSLEEEKEQMTHLKLETVIDRKILPSSQFIHEPEMPTDKLGLDEIYMINLKRRPLRRQRMMYSLGLLGIDARVRDAVDGKALTSDDLIAMGIDMLPGYRDPYGGRVLTKGEIGCFMSHYQIWQEMVQKSYHQVMVLEDDVRFEQGFTGKLTTILNDVALNQIDWDLIYVGRKILDLDEEKWVYGVRNLVKPAYSYWTLGYILTLRGAKKLLAQDPIGRMVPVDEYLPIMFDVHPEKDWASPFWPRDLKAFSVNPLLLQPTHYVGESNYFSDTETSSIWEDVVIRESERNPKGDEIDEDEEEADASSEHVKLPTARDAKSDGITAGFSNNTGHKEQLAKDQTVKEGASSPAAAVVGETEKLPKNEKSAVADADEQSTPSSKQEAATDGRHTEL